MISSKIIHDGPTTGQIRYWLGRLWMGLTGWDVVGKIPPGGKFVLIGEPHTSNWDFVFMLTAFYILRIKVSWIGKDTLFKKPFGGIMRWLGGISIKRDSRSGAVDQIVKRFKETDKLVIVLSPSGTRKLRDYLKSGFYWIGYNAQVPILCGYLDYAKKIAGIGLSFVPTGNIRKDMDRIREFFKGVQGKYPERAARIRLKDEDI